MKPLLVAAPREVPSRRSTRQLSQNDIADVEYQFLAEQEKTLTSCTP